MGIPWEWEFPFPRTPLVVTRSTLSSERPGWISAGDRYGPVLHQHHQQWRWRRITGRQCQPVTQTDAVPVSQSVSPLGPPLWLLVSDVSCLQLARRSFPHCPVDWRSLAEMRCVLKISRRFTAIYFIPITSSVCHHSTAYLLFLFRKKIKWNSLSSTLKRHSFTVMYPSIQRFISDNRVISERENKMYLHYYTIQKHF